MLPQKGKSVTFLFRLMASLLSGAAGVLLRAPPQRRVLCPATRGYRRRRSRREDAPVCRASRPSLATRLVCTPQRPCAPTRHA